MAILLFVHLTRHSSTQRGAAFETNATIPRPYSGAAICLIIPCSSALTLSNNIIQKGLAFGRDWSGSVVNSGR
jgi:hypothetical protein